MIKAYPIKINIPKYFLKKISVDCNSPFFGIIKDRIGLKKYKNELYERKNIRSRSIDAFIG